MSDQWWVEAAEFVKNQLDQDEWWAREASRSWDGATLTGEHWRWECETTGQPVTVDPVLDAFVEGADHSAVGLRSVEEYPTRSVGPLPHLVLSGQHEVTPAVAGHITRHHPARTMADVASDRQLLAIALHQLRDDGEDQAAGDMVRALATRHAEREGFNAEWVMSGEDWQL